MVRLSRSAGIWRAVVVMAMTSDDPDQEQAHILEVADDAVVIEEFDRAEQQGDERGEEKQDVEILPPIHFLDHHPREGKDIVHIRT